MSVRSIAQEGLNASRSFHLFSRTQKNIGDAVDTLQQLSRYGDGYVKLERMTGVAASPDPEIKLAQYQDLLGKIAEGSALQTGAELSGLAGLSLLYTERLPADQRERARANAARVIAQSDPLLAQVSSYPGTQGTQLLKFFETATQESSHELATELFTERKKNLEPAQVEVLDKYERAGVELSVLMSAASGGRGALATALKILDGGNEKAVTRLEPTTLGLVQQHLQGRPELAPIDAAFEKVGLDTRQRLKALVLAEAEIRPETTDFELTRWAWNHGRKGLTNDESRRLLASELLEGWSQKFPATSKERGVLSMLAGFQQPEQALDGFLGQREFPEDFRAAALLARAALQRVPYDQVLEDFDELAPGLSPYVTDPVQGEMISLLGQLSQREAHDHSGVVSAAINGLQAMDKDLVGFGIQLLNYTRRPGDAINISNDLWEALARQKPAHADIWKAIKKMDQELANDDQESRRRIHRGALYSLQRGAQPDAAKMMIGIHNEGIDACYQVHALRALAGCESATNPRARLARDITHHPFESAQNRFYAAYELFTQNQRGETEMQNLALGALRAANRASSDPMAQRWVLRRALEISLEEARAHPRPGEAPALFEALKLCQREEAGDATHQAAVANELLRAGSQSERYGPFQLAAGCKAALRLVVDKHRDAFGRAALDSLQAVAERIGDEEHIPKRLEECRQQLQANPRDSYSIFTRAFDQITALDSEAYWMSMEEKDPTEFEFREDEIQIGDVSLEI